MERSAKRVLHGSSSTGPPAVAWLILMSLLLVIACAGPSTTSTAPVASVEVSPPSATLSVGSTQQFQATVSDASGGVVAGCALVWSSSDTSVAAVSGSGLVSAKQSGMAVVTADCEGRSGSATLTIIQPASSQVDTLFHEGFESGSLDGWNDNYRPNNKWVETNPDFAYAGSRYLRILYPKGSDGGSLSKFLQPGYQRMYARYFVYFPPQWEGGAKMLLLRGSRADDIWSSFGVAGDCPKGTDFFLTNVVLRNTATPDLHFYTYYVGMPPQSDGSTCWGSYGDGNPSVQYFPPLTVAKGKWHLVEFEVQLNAPGRADGEQRFWLNGELKGVWTGLTYRTTEDLLLNVFTIESSGNQPPQDQSIYVDEVLVTTARRH